MAGTAPAPTEPLLLARAVRGNGGTVVATGGCFDLLHAGHVRSLAAARELGDCLIVCLNSDSSVRRLKGQERPIIGQQDRAELLLAMECVDAVMVFDEDTPEAALDRLRPTSGSRAATTKVPGCRKRSSWRAGAAGASLFPTIRHGPPPGWPMRSPRWADPLSTDSAPNRTHPKIDSPLKGTP